MARAVLLVALLIGCGRIGFDAASGTIDGDGGTDAPLPVGRWQSVAIAEVSGCAITVTGELWCMGQGFAGQLGTGEKPSTSPPSRVGTASDWATISLDYEHTCGVRLDGSLWCWGSNYQGALGTGVMDQHYVTPQQVSAGTTWKTVETGDNRACAIRSDDTLWCWGNNNSGALGIGSITDQPRPTQVGTSTWSAIAVGDTSACGLMTDGSAWCWGANYSGQVGDGSGAERRAPVPVMAGTTWLDIDVGYEHACAITSAGTTWCWGRNYEAQLGDGTSTNRFIPTEADLPPSAQIATGGFHTCASTAAGQLWCWGDASRGRISGFDTNDVESPTQVTAPIVTRLAGGGHTTCLIDDEGHLFCSGANGSGQTGLPAGEVHGLERSDARTDWQSIYAQGTHACGLVAGGRAYCWGRGFAGQIGDGDIVDRQVPVAAGTIAFDRMEIGQLVTVGYVGTTAYQWGYDLVTDMNVRTPTMRGVTSQLGIGYDHACYTEPTGVMSCVGDNMHGQLGDGTTTSTTNAVMLAGTWELVAAGNQVSCGTLAPAGPLKCWGNGVATGTGTVANVLNPQNVGGLGTPITRIELGASGGCALVGAGELWCWGNNYFGEAGDGTTQQRLTAVRTGTRSDWRVVDWGDVHVCAIPADGTLWCWGHDDQGQLGQTTEIALSVPTQVGTDTNWSDVACGDHFTCALRADGTRWCFGVNSVGELGNGRSWLPELTVVP